MKRCTPKIIVPRIEKTLYEVISEHEDYDLADFIYFMRRARKVSRMDITKCRTKAVTLANLELNKHKPSRKTLMIVSNFFNVPFEIIANKAAEMVSRNYYRSITLKPRQTKKRKDKECS